MDCSLLEHGQMIDLCLSILFLTPCLTVLLVLVVFDEFLRISSIRNCIIYKYSQHYFSFGIMLIATFKLHGCAHLRTICTLHLLENMAQFLLRLSGAASYILSSASVYLSLTNMVRPWEATGSQSFLEMLISRSRVKTKSK